MSEFKRLPTLDGLRAVAVGVVMLSHAAQSVAAPRWLMAVSRFMSGEIGVLIFFTISGFIITHLLLREHERNGRISLAGFWYRRAFRILPPLVALLGVLQLLDFTGCLRVGAASQWASLFFVRNHVQGGWFNGHLWSLSVEEQFYLAWPLLVVVVLRGGGSVPFRWMVLGTVVMRGCLAWGGALGLASYGLIGNVDALMLGCWGAWHLAGKTTFWPGRFLALIAAHWPVMVVLVAFLSFVKSSRFALLAQTINPAIIGLVTISIIQAHLHSEESLLFRMLNARWLSWIGRMSYSLYLWQQLFLCPAGAWQCSPGWAVGLPANLLCAVTAGYLSFRWIEVPSLSWRTR